MMRPEKPVRFRVLKIVAWWAGLVVTALVFSVFLATVIFTPDVSAATVIATVLLGGFTAAYIGQAGRFGQ